jgi:exonuclease V gamma subunit
LQSFSARYFDPEDRLAWLALDAESFAGAEARDRTLQSGGGHSRRFLERLGEDEKETERAREGASIPRLRLEELIDRWLYATRTFARDRLGVRLPRPEESVPDFDPVSLGALEKSQLGAALLADLRSGASRQEAAERLVANARLPMGTAGRIEAESLRQEAFDLAAIAEAREAQEGEGERIVDFPFSLELPVDLDSLSAESTRPVEWPTELARARRLRLSGLLTGVRESGRLGLSFSRLAGRSEGVFWIEHLVLCALVEAGAFLEAGLRVSPESVLIGRPESKRAPEPVVVMRAVPNAREELARLCALASTGTRAPLPFFPRTSRRFADRVREEKVDQAWRDAHQNFYGGDSDFARAEIEEGLEFQRVWEGTRPLESSKDSALLFSFEDLSLQFFEPLWACREVRSR